MKEVMAKISFLSISNIDGLS